MDGFCHLTVASSDSRCLRRQGFLAVGRANSRAYNVFAARAVILGNCRRDICKSGRMSWPICTLSDTAKIKALFYISGNAVRLILREHFRYRRVRIISAGID